MKIPVGNFGFSTPEPVDRSPITRATDRLGQIVQGVGVQIDEKQQALARAKDATAYQEHALAVDTLKADYAAKIDSGEVPYDSAKAAFEADAAKIPAPKPNARDPAAAEALTRGTQMSIKRAGLDINQVANGARDKDLQSQGVSQLDALGKRVSLPGADVASINAQADAVGPVLRASGLSEAQVSRTIQNFKDTNWFNEATGVAIQSRDSLTALKQLEHDLTAKDGFYVTRLDTEKRNAVLAQVVGHRLQLENKLLAVGDRREAAAGRTVLAFERQISSGIPATPNMWTTGADTVKGTTFEPEFKALVESEQEIQGVLRAPIADQVRLVQEREADLDKNGGTLAQASNVNRLNQAVRANIKSLVETPVLFGEQRLGDQNEPISAADFANSPEDTAANLQERATRINAFSKQFGIPVPMRPLLPQEVKDLAGAIQSSSPDKVADLFGALSQASGSADVFRGIMQQVAPDSPVRAYAGQIYGHTDPVTLQSHAFSPDEQVAQRVVARTIVQGESIINQTRQQKGEDGKPVKNLYVPDKASFDTAFADHVGDAFADRPDALDLAQQVAYSYYVGKSAQTGRLNAAGEKIDDATMQEALHASIGDSPNFHGYGHVILPLGMDSDQFTTAARDQFVAEVGGDSKVALNAFPSLGLRNLDANRYLVTKGRAPFSLKGRPIILDLSKPLPARAPAKPLGDEFVPL